MYSFGNYLKYLPGIEIKFRYETYMTPLTISGIVEDDCYRRLHWWVLY